MRLLITGSRQWIDSGLLIGETTIAIGELWWRSHQPVTVVHGACPSGADRMASEFIKSLRLDAVREEPHPAAWHEFGKSAGYRRNAEMVKLGADLCLAFIVPGQSRGTEHTANLARAAGIPVREVKSHG